MRRLSFLIIITAAVFAVTGCGIDANTFNIHDSSSSSPDIRLSGNLSLGGSSKSYVTSRGVVTRVVSDYKLYCVTFEETPAATTGTVAGTGSFDFSFAGARNVPFGCFVQKVSDSSVVGTLVFQDSTETGLDGSSQQQGTVSLTGSADLGSITLDLDTGTATVDMSNVKLTDTDLSAVADTSSLGEGELFDFTGTWTFQAMDGATPDGYTPLSTDCNDGPCVGFPIYMKRVQGKAYEYSGTDESATDWLAGTTNQNKNVFGTMIWASEKAYQTCGSAIGFTNEEAKRYGRVDFAGYVGGSTGINFVFNPADPINGNFKWTNGVVNTFESDGVTPLVLDIALGWQDANAQAQWDIWTETTPGEVFLDANGNGWYDDAEWWDDWSTADGRSGNGIYDPGEWFDDWNGNGVRDSGEQFFDGFFSFTDSNGNNIYDLGESLGSYNVTFDQDPSLYDWPQWTPVASSGDPCSPNLDAYPLEQARCYADSLHNLPEQNDDICIKDIRFNWHANNLADFMNSNQGPVRPRSRYVFEKFVYSSPTSGSFTSTDQWEEGFEYFDPDAGNGGESRWVSCQMIDSMEFNITYLNAITLVGDMKQIRLVLPASKGSDPMCEIDHEPYQDINSNNERDNDQYADDGTGGCATCTAGNSTFDYDDVNGNNKHDVGEASEPITVDDNSNGAYENEPYKDIDGDGNYTSTGFHAWVEQQLRGGVTRTMMKFLKQ